MSVRILTCCIAIFVVLCVLGTSNSATIGHKSHMMGEKKIINNNEALRQAQDYSIEDSDEDDEEDDAERLQFNAQQQQQLQEDSLEDSDEDDGEDFDQDDYRRKRRDISAAKAVATQSEDKTTTDDKKISENSKTPDDNKKLEDNKTPEENNIKEPNKEVTPDSEEDSKKDENLSVVAAPPSRKPSVLILIRDALKKVTTLPTEQVATNALQYFQLFEHFLQQTIEQVIDNVDDDDDEEATTVKSEVEVNLSPEEGEEIIKEPELVNKVPTEAPAEANEVPMKQVEGGEEAIKEPEIVNKVQPEAPTEANKIPSKEIEEKLSTLKNAIHSRSPILF